MTDDHFSVNPLAAGEPINRVVADAAADWLTLLMSGEATEQEQQAWRQWRADHADHERAWQHIETITGQIKMLEPKAAYQTLSSLVVPADASVSSGRRKTLELLALGGFICTAGLLVSRTQTVQQLTADYRTGTGEQRQFTLEDGTDITLNTATSVTVDFNSQQRVLRLVAGEVLIQTGHKPGFELRPFIVQTVHGHIRALGTRFSVRQQQEHTMVAVLESAVEITPASVKANTLKIGAGEQVSFTRDTISTTQQLSEQTTAWPRGQLLADNLRLGNFVAELNRYRPGLLRCDPAIADLRLSGVFPLQDTNRILATLPQVLPVQVIKRTDYWVTIQGAPQ